MNISRIEKRVLDVLAQGGRILMIKDEAGRLMDISCVTGEGWRLSICTLDLFKGLRRRRLVVSTGGGPYLISRLGLLALSQIGQKRERDLQARDRTTHKKGKR